MADDPPPDADPPPLDFSSEAAGAVVNKVNDQTAASQEKIKQNTASETTTPKLRKFTAQGEYEKVKASVGLEPPPEPGSKKKLPVEGAVVEDDDNPFQGSIKMIALGRTDGTVVSWWFSEVSLRAESIFAHLLFDPPRYVEGCQELSCVHQLQFRSFICPYRRVSTATRP